MIKTNILVVECDGCHVVDIFRAEPGGQYGNAVRPSQEDMARECWTEVVRWHVPTEATTTIHLCKNCYKKGDK